MRLFWSVKTQVLWEKTNGFELQKLTYIYSASMRELRPIFSFDGFKSLYFLSQFFMFAKTL